MVEFWIKMSSFLILLLHLTAAVTGQPVLRVAVRVGDEVTLPCENVIGNQDKCERTDWFFGAPGSSEAVYLIRRGQIVERAKPKSDRLNVTQNCSLVIKKVTDEDAGHYTCRQYKSGYRDSRVYLSVVNMTEHENNDEVKLTCSVSVYERCRYRVEWLYEGKVKDKETSRPRCSDNFTYEKKESEKFKLFHCEVTDLYNVEVWLFSFSRQSSGEKPVDATPTMATPTTAAAMAATTTTTSPQEGWWRFTIVSVALAALIIIVVAVNVWTRTKGRKTQTDENVVADDEDDGAVNYENVTSSV